MRSQSLHARFRTAVLCTAAVLSTIVTVFVYRTAKSHYIETGEASASAIVAAVEKTVAVGAYARDQVLLKELVEGLARHPSVSRVAILDINGTLLAAAPTIAADSSASDAVPDDAAPSFETSLTSPFDASESSGRLQVWLDWKRLSAEAVRQASMLVGALIVLLASVFGVLNTLAGRMLTRPMHRLASELALIEPGTSRRVPVDPRHERDEVGVVVAAANRLLDLQQHALERERAMRDEIAEMEARYRGIFDSTSAGIFIMSSQGRLLQANPALARLLNSLAPGADVEQSGDFASSTFRDPPQLAALIAKARLSSQPEATDLALVREVGDESWVHCMVSVTRDGPTGEERVEGVLYDVTLRKYEESVSQHRAEHDALTGLKSRAYIESSLDRCVQTARQQGGNMTLLFIDLDGFKGVNDRWGHAAGDAVLVESARRLRSLFKRSCDMVGRLGGDELVVLIEGVEASCPTVSDMAERLIRSFDRPFALPSGESTRVGASVGVASYPMHATSAETLIHAADAAMYAVKQAGKGGFSIAATDIAAGRGMQGEVGEAAHPRPALQADTPAAWPASKWIDPLTGLSDRRQLGERLASTHASVSRGEGFAVVVCMDIDQFKSINLAHGSPVGDEVLCEVARRLGAAVRRDDTVARTGSDEFVAVVHAEAADQPERQRKAESIARKLLNQIAGSFPLSCGPLTVQVSAGVSLIDARTADPLEVLREAQLALRSSKTMLRSGPVLFESKMMSGFHDQLALEEDLRAAIGTEQLFLHVQPQVDRHGVVTGGEALLRWQHPRRGLVPPDVFIPLAEASGDIIDLGNWVLRAGCEVLARMRCGQGDETLSINISPAQFNHPDFVRSVREALSSSHAPADGLILEITENLLIADIAAVTARLNDLVALGVRFSIDDFGTGFSSLSYLRHLPLYELKIDRSFMLGVPQDGPCAGIVRSIISMGAHLGLNVVAEGVETEAQAGFLLAEGCAFQQGWLHGRPGPVADFLRSIGARQRAMSTAAEALLLEDQGAVALS